MNRSFVGLMFSLLLVLPTQAQEPSTIDALQSNRRVESIKSLQQFMFDIAFLDLGIQERLIKARLTNGLIIFNTENVLPSEENHSTTNALSIQKDLWTTSSTVYLAYKNDRYLDDTLLLRLEIELEPNSTMNDWVKARDEYTSYSKEEVSNEYATLSVTGPIAKFTWKKEATHHVDSEPIYDPLTYVLTLRLRRYSTHQFKIYGPSRWLDGKEQEQIVLHGSVAGMTNYLREHIALWVKFYMGKGKKPALILE